MTIKKLINVCGAPRSGSTMVDLMIGNDPRAFSLGEIHAWFRPFRSHHFQIICSCQSKNCPWQTLNSLKEKEFYKKCFEILDVDTLVDSSKNIAWVIDNNIRVSKENIPVYNVLLYKDPISFIYSYWKRGDSIEEAIHVYFIKYYKRFFEANLPFISINYNHLVTNPAPTLKVLCDILSIPYFEGKERFWEKNHHHLFGSGGTRKQIRTAATRIRKKDEYPVEFEKQIPRLETIINNTPEMQTVLSRLMESELCPVSSYNASVHKPYWYYLLKLKQKFRQIFPEKWEYRQ